jgi:hypothetical protein
MTTQLLQGSETEDAWVPNELPVSGWVPSEGGGGRQGFCLCPAKGATGFLFMSSRGSNIPETLVQVRKIISQEKKAEEWEEAEGL